MSGALSIVAAAWISLAPVLTPRQEISVAAANGKVYIIGGLAGNDVLSSVEEYDPQTDRWRFVAPVPQPVHHAAAATLDNMIYVVGGYRTISFAATKEVFRYDPAADRWTQLADLPSPRGALAAAAIDEKIYAVGGAPTFRELVVYDPAVDRWTTLSPMPTPREHLAAVAFGGKLYVVGGRAGTNTGAFEMYDPLTDRWTTLASLPTPRSGLAAAVLNNRVYVFGGEGNPAAPTGVFSQNESFDFVSGSWRSEPPMPTPRHGIGAAAIGGRIFIPAGATVAGFGTSDVHEAFATDLPGRRRAVRR
ncbi:MAG TPA: kelch repeat-containing protein [Thermoanaerobaculia bacterium]